MATYKDIATYTGLSIGTISNVLRGKSSIKKENKEKVIAAINDLGYRVNYQASALASEKTFLLGLVISTTESIVVDRILLYMENFAEAHGYRLLWSTSRNDMEREKDKCEAMLSSKVDCLFVFLQSTENESYFKRLSETEKIPIILLTRYFDNVNLPFVAVDNYYAAKVMVQYMFDKGHRQLTYIDITEEAELSPNRDRRNGIIKSCKELGIKCNIIERPALENDITVGYLAAQDMIQNGSMPKAVLPRDDSAALGFYNACLRYGVRIPEDVSIMGFGKFYSDYTTPKMLTTYQPNLEMVINRATQMFWGNEWVKSNASDKLTGQHFIRGYIVEGETVADLT